MYLAAMSLATDCCPDVAPAAPTTSGETAILHRGWGQFHRWSSIQPPSGTIVVPGTLRKSAKDWNLDLGFDKKCLDSLIGSKERMLISTQD